MRSLAAVALSLVLIACSPTRESEAPAARAPATPSDLALPSAPGSLAPFLHSGPEGLLRAAWLDPAPGGGHAVRVCTHDGETWSEPVTVSSGTTLLANWADTPTLRDLGGDRLVVSWPVMRPDGNFAYDLAIAFSEDGGASWRMIDQLPGA